MKLLDWFRKVDYKILIIGIVVLFLIRAPYPFWLVFFLYILFWMYVHLRERVHNKTLSRNRLWTKGIVIGASIALYLWVPFQIYVGSGGKHAGMLWIVFFFVIMIPYIVTVVVVDDVQDGTFKGSRMTFWIILLILGLSVGYFSPWVGVATIFIVPLMIYTAIYAKKGSRTQWMAIFLTVVYLVCSPYFFIKGTELGHKIIDSCFDRISSAKGESHRIQDSRVCVPNDNQESSYYVTLDNADAKTYKLIGGEYAKDKNRVYYKNKPINADPATFKFIDSVYKDKSGTWENGVLVTK